MRRVSETAIHEVSHPDEEIVDGRRRILHHQMARTLIPMHGRVRQASLQIVQIQVREHRIAWTPEQQGRHRQ
jgi:hypothetical protein